ncbi:MAG: OmpA family protein, partial [Bacteroidia bacterium]|nr:OmpA family protein [Bacteroidia bacterium]
DSDKDGVDDEKDKCPSIPGTVANNGCPEVKKEITEKVSYAARRVYFNTASYQLRTVSYKGLNEVADILKSDPDLKLTVEGHTDNVGIADKNKILSLQRAYAVKEYLVKRGIKADRITIAGYGEEQPVASNNTPEGRAQNRRVVMRVEY